MAKWDKHAINYGVGNVMKTLFSCSTRVFVLLRKTTININFKSCKVNPLCFKTNIKILILKKIINDGW